MHKYEQTARKRLEILRKHYDENGQLLLKDVMILTGTSFDSLCKTFETYNLEMPVVWDSRKEKTRRKADALNKEAKRLNQDYLTFRQVFKVLGKGEYRTGHVISVEYSIMRYGFSIPEIRNDSDVAVFNGKYNSDPNDNFPEIAHKSHGIINPLWHPRGLQVLTYWTDWPTEGQTTYLLR